MVVWAVYSLLHLMPIFGPMLAFALLGEAPTAAQGTGAVLVLCGILIVERRAAGLLAPASRPA